MVLTFTKNKRFFEADANNLAMANYNAVRTGCNVVVHAPTDMGIRVQVGSVYFGQTVVNVSQQDLAVNPSDPSNDRIDLVVVNSSGVASIITGTAEIEPHTPDYNPLSYVVIARVLVDDLVTTIEATAITDLRVLRYELFAKYIESGIVSQTTVVVNHNLGDAEPMIACYEGNTTLVLPESAVINNANQATLTFSPAFTGKIIVYGGTGGIPIGGSGSITLTVKEQDGIPTVYNVDQIKVSNNTLTDNGGGTVSLDLTSVPTSTHIHTQSSPALVWNISHNLGHKYVQVICYDGSDNWIQPNQIALVDANTVQITFLGSQSGTAVIKK